MENMFKPSKRSIIVTSMFLATSSLITGCAFSESEQAQVANNGSVNNSPIGQYLLDDNGKEYKLIKNEDGTETAKYADGQEVTFNRYENSSFMDYVSGNAGLLTALAAGYFMFHGFNNSVGHYDTGKNRYVLDEPLKKFSNQESRQKALKGKYVPPNRGLMPLQKYQEQQPQATGSSSGRSGGSTYVGGRSRSSSVESNSSKSSTSKSSVSSTKSGFGGAGARSASS